MQQHAEWGIFSFKNTFRQVGENLLNRSRIDSIVNNIHLRYSANFLFRIFSNVSTKTNLSAKPFQPVNRGPRCVRLMRKKCLKNLVTLPLQNWISALKVLFKMYTIVSLLPTKRGVFWPRRLYVPVQDFDTTWQGPKWNLGKTLIVKFDSTIMPCFLALFSRRKVYSSHIKADLGIRKIKIILLLSL